MSNKNTTIGDEKVAKFIKEAGKGKGQTSIPKSELIIHQYKWRAQEIIIVVALFAVAVGFGIWAILNDMSVGAFVVSGIALVLGIAVTNLGASRKRKSRLTAIYSAETQEIAVEGNGHDPATNNGNLSKITSVGTKKVGREDDIVDPKDLLIISFGESKNIKIPMRLVGKPELHKVLKDAIESVNNTKLSGKLAEFFDAAAKYKG